MDSDFIIKGSVYTLIPIGSERVDPSTPKLKSTFSKPSKEKCIDEVVRILVV